ncbi:MAG: MFS transporter [Corynebacteriales bacterium]|nr:MFS transporter [Mycobacteriales bacterium]
MRRLAPRWRALFLAVLVGLSLAIFVGPAQPAHADCDWKTPWDCLPGRNDGNSGPGSQLDCVEAPAASRPDSGLAGWFTRQPKNPSKDDPFADKAKVSQYDVYGYAGYDFATYDLGCGPDAVREPGAVTTTTIANLIYAPALWLVALDNSVREYAYQPNAMWGWTNELVENASNALRDRVFTAWGAFVVAIVGLWLLWGARNGNISAAVNTAGWAILVMVFVSAVAMWPIKSSTIADTTLTGALGQVNGALAGESPNDKRDPAVKASGVLTRTVLYNQWLRGTIGSSDSDVAKRYGPDLYRARAISWAEAKEMAEDPNKRDKIFDEKAALWDTTAEKIKDEDPEAYEYLVGRKGTERIGAAILAFVSALVVTPFDIMASLLVLVAFLIVRLAVVFLPAIGTVGMFLPASGPLRGMLRTVVAAMINCVIFGAGSAVFLLGVEIITSTHSLAGWQQILLIWLVGLILWLLLRPYRRLTELTGVDPFTSMAGGLGRMHQRVFGDMKQLAGGRDESATGGIGASDAHERYPDKKKQGGLRLRPETWSRKKPGLAKRFSSFTAKETAARRPEGKTAVPNESRSGAMSAPAMAASSEYRQRGEGGSANVPGPRMPTGTTLRTEESYPVYRPEAKPRRLAEQNSE